MLSDDVPVDVIIPSYNGLPYLLDAIASALLQTRRPNRIIVVDDGSTDGTLERLERFNGSIDVIVHPENRGLPAARNTGLRASDAPLVAFLDADDVWLPGKLERQVKEFVDAPSIGLVYGSLLDCDMSLTPLGPPRKVRPKRAEWVFDELYLKAFAMPPSTVMVRREVFERSGYFDETMRKAQDFECWLRIAMDYPISAVPEPLCLRRVNPQSITATTGLERGIGYVFRVFDLCGAAAERKGVRLPMSVEARKRLFLWRSLRDSLLGNDAGSFRFFLSKLNGKTSGMFEEICTEAVFGARRLFAVMAAKHRGKLLQNI